MKRKKIIFVSHCILNTATKVYPLNSTKKSSDKLSEETLRKLFLTKAIQCDIQIVQLPCPEHKIYGTERWGHVKDQFEHPHFIKQCRNMLEPIVEDLQSFSMRKEKYEIIGLLGVDGSPSCGVNFTCRGHWGGEIMSNTRLSETLETIYTASEKGIMIEVLSEMLKEANISIPFYGLDAKKPETIKNILELCHEDRFESPLKKI